MNNPKRARFCCDIFAGKLKFSMNMCKSDDSCRYSRTKIDFHSSMDLCDLSLFYWSLHETKNKIKLCIPLLMETKLKLFLEKNAADFASRRITAVFQMCPK